MLKICCRFFILVLLVGTVCFVQARPQFKIPIQAIAKVNERLNESSVSFIKKLTQNNVSRDENNNKTKTRILFRGNRNKGELMGELGDQDIIFPDTYQIIFETIPRIDGPPKCAKGTTFCEDFDPYPYHQLKDILERKHVHNDLFGKDELPDEKYSITNRNSDTELYICTSIQKTIFPKIGKNKNNKWKYIINQEESDGYIQGIRIELCRKEGPCDLIGERPEGYITSCKQKFMLRRLMSISDSGDPVQDTFQLPSACCCSYRKDFSFLSRFGVTDISSRTKGRG